MSVYNIYRSVIQRRSSGTARENVLSEDTLEAVDMTFRFRFLIKGRHTALTISGTGHFFCCPLYG
jgi:hypothetical protein